MADLCTSETVCVVQLLIHSYAKNEKDNIFYYFFDELPLHYKYVVYIKLLEKIYNLQCLSLKLLKSSINHEISILEMVIHIASLSN